MAQNVENEHLRQLYVDLAAHEKAEQARIEEGQHILKTRKSVVFQDVDDSVQARSDRQCDYNAWGEAEKVIASIWNAKADLLQMEHRIYEKRELLKNGTPKQKKDAAYAIISGFIHFDFSYRRLKERVYGRHKHIVTMESEHES